MTTEWSHLPNAKHIDCILANLKAHPDEWDASWAEVWGSAWNTAREAAWSSTSKAVRDVAQEAVREAAKEAAWNAAKGAEWTAAREAAWNAVLVLIAYDESAKYLDMSYEKLKFWAELSSDPAALLLLTAVYVFNKEPACQEEVLFG